MPTNSRWVGEPDGWTALVKDPPWLMVLPGALETGARIELDAAEARHAAGALRLRTGDVVMLADGAGAVARARLREGVKGRVEAEIMHLAIVPKPSGPGVSVAVAVVENRAMDWLVQKSVEVGVRTLLPLLTERTQAGIREAERRSDHWRRIARQALKQCRRSWGMEISSAVSMPEILSRVEPGSGIVADPGGGPVAELLPASGWVLAVGPEGGFSPAEGRQFADSGWRRMRLGPHVLRTETAAIVGAAFLVSRTGEADVHSGDA